MYCIALPRQNEAPHNADKNEDVVFQNAVMIQKKKVRMEAKGNNANAVNMLAQGWEAQLLQMRDKNGSKYGTRSKPSRLSGKSFTDQRGAQQSQPS